jgi:hypothetical protein
VWLKGRFSHRLNWGRGPRGISHIKSPPKFGGTENFVPRLAARRATIGETARRAKHTQGRALYLWGTIFKGEEKYIWLTLTVRPGCNPILIGKDLQKLYHNNSIPQYLTLLPNNPTGVMVGEGSQWRSREGCSVVKIQCVQTFERVLYFSSAVLQGNTSMPRLLSFPFQVKTSYCFPSLLLCCSPCGSAGVLYYVSLHPT